MDRVSLFLLHRLATRAKTLTKDDGMKFFGMMMMALLVSAQAFAANPRSKDLADIMSRSALLKGIQHGVAKDYKVPHCRPYSVVSYDQKAGALKAEAYCTYEDASGDSSGVWIQVDGVFWDNETLILEKASFTLAG
jgi:hypothetical protein